MRPPPPRQGNLTRLPYVHVVWLPQVDDHESLGIMPSVKTTPNEQPLMSSGVLPAQPVGKVETLLSVEWDSRSSWEYTKGCCKQ